MDLIELGFLLYWPVLVGNGLAIIICLIAGPRPWSRRLSAFFFWLTAGFLTLVLLELIEFVVETGLRDEGGMGFGIIITGCFPVLMEFILLLAIRRPRLFWHSPK